MYLHILPWLTTSYCWQCRHDRSRHHMVHTQMLSMVYPIIRDPNWVLCYQSHDNSFVIRTQQCLWAKVLRTCVKLKRACNTALLLKVSRRVNSDYIGRECCRTQDADSWDCWKQTGQTGESESRSTGEISSWDCCSHLITNIWILSNTLM